MSIRRSLNSCISLASHSGDPHPYGSSNGAFYSRPLYNQEHPGRCRGGVCCWERRGRNPTASYENSGDDTRHLVEYSGSTASPPNFNRGTRDLKSLHHLWSRCESVKVSQRAGRLPRPKSENLLPGCVHHYYSLSNTPLRDRRLEDARTKGVAGCRTELWAVMKVPNLTSVQYDIITNSQVSPYRKWKRNPIVLSSYT